MSRSDEPCPEGPTPPIRAALRPFVSHRPTEVVRRGVFPAGPGPRAASGGPLRSRRRLSRGAPGQTLPSPLRVSGRPLRAECLRSSLPSRRQTRRYVMRTSTSSQNPDQFSRPKNTFREDAQPRATSIDLRAQEDLQRSELPRRLPQLPRYPAAPPPGHSYRRLATGDPPREKPRESSALASPPRGSQPKQLAPSRRVFGSGSRRRLRRGPVPSCSGVTRCPSAVAHPFGTPEPRSDIAPPLDGALWRIGIWVTRLPPTSRPEGRVAVPGNRPRPMHPATRADRRFRGIPRPRRWSSEAHPSGSLSRPKPFE